VRRPVQELPVVLSMKVTELEANHVWKATPGYRIVVLDGGAVRFDILRDWVVHARENNVLIFDREPLDNRCSLGFSWHRLPLESSMAPLTLLLAHGCTTETRPILERSPIRQVNRPPLEIVWRQFRVRDEPDTAEMCVRMCIARSGTTQAVFLFEFRPEDELAFFQPWETLLQTLAVGEYISDSATGRRYQQLG
jgi:hypothetical protein